MLTICALSTVEKIIRIDLFSQKGNLANKVNFKVFCIENINLRTSL